MNKCTTNINLTQEVNAILPNDIQDVFSCYSLAAKNIRNKTTFCISNIQSAYAIVKILNLIHLKIFFILTNLT